MRLLRRLFALSVLLAALILIAPHTTSTAQTPQPVEPPPHVYPPDLTDPGRLSSDKDFQGVVDLPSDALPGIQGSSTEPNFQPWTQAAGEIYDIDKGWWDIYTVNMKDWINRAVTQDAAIDMQPNVKPATGEIVFASDRSGNFDIWHWKNGSIKSLTSDANDDYEPNWSPEGSRVVFVSERDGDQEIFLMQADGSRQVRLTSNSRPDFSPAWSPDGKYIIWVQAIDNQYGAIMRMKADGTSPTLIKSPLRLVENVEYSPYGDKIGFDYDANADGWMDVAVLDLNDYTIDVWEYGTYYDSGYPRGCDYLVGSWVDNETILGGSVGYAYYDGEWYITGAGPFFYSPMFVNTPSWDGDRPSFAFNNDAALTDPYPPVTRVLPLPEYVPSSGYMVYLEGSDPGFSGIHFVGVERRVGEDGIWKTGLGWYPGETSPSILWTYDEPGTISYFRSQGIDEAENIEQWPAEYDTMTRVYDSLLSGLVFDNRETPILNAQVNITPLPWTEPVTDAQGKYARHTSTLDYSANAGHPLFGVQPETLFSGNDNFDWSLPPLDDQIANGGFEQDGSWTFSGSQQPQRLSSAAHTGETGLSLGKVVISTEAVPYTDGSVPIVGFDSDGNEILVWVTIDSVMYSRKSGDGTWSSPLQLSSDPYVSSTCLDMTMGLDGSVHVVWLDIEGGYGERPGSIKYARVTSDATVQENTVSPVTGILTSNTRVYCPQIVVDSTNSVHIVWYGGNQTGTDGGWYSSLPFGGSWSVPESIGINRPHGLFIDQDDRLYTGVGGGNSILIKRRENGTWNAGIAFPNQTVGYEIAVNAAGQVFILYHNTGTTPGISIQSIDYDTGTLSAPILLGHATSATYPYPESLISGPDNRVHAVYQTEDHKFLYQVISPTDGLSSVVDLGIKAYASVKKYSATEQGGMFYTDIIGNNRDIIIRSLTITQHLDSAASETVTVPVEMKNPTLSFFYKIATNPGNETLHVVANGTEVFTTSQPTQDWSHVWVDMGSYAGQQVKLDFYLEVPIPLTEGSLLLDEVSLGSWKTPWLKAVSPGRIPTSWTGQILTIDVENYVEGSTLFLGDAALENIQVVDDDTITAAIPAGLSPGEYHLRMENPDGMQAELPEDVYLGTTNFIPFINAE